MLDPYHLGTPDFPVLQFHDCHVGHAFNLLLNPKVSGIIQAEEVVFIAFLLVSAYSVLPKADTFKSSSPESGTGSGRVVNTRGLSSLERLESDAKIIAFIHTSYSF